MYCDPRRNKKKEEEDEKQGEEKDRVRRGKKIRTSKVVHSFKMFAA